MRGANYEVRRARVEGRRANCEGRGVKFELRRSRVEVRGAKVELRRANCEGRITKCEGRITKSKVDVLNFLVQRAFEQQPSLALLPQIIDFRLYNLAHWLVLTDTSLHLTSLKLSL